MLRTTFTVLHNVSSTSSDRYLLLTVAAAIVYIVIIISISFQSVLIPSVAVGKKEE